MFSEGGAAPFVVHRAPRERRPLFGLKSQRLGGVGVAVS